MKRVYFRYENLEEYRAGMWRIVRGDERKRYIEQSAELMKDVGAFHAAMTRAVREWPNSCAHNLSAESMNRIAWLGHAGCCVAHHAPEDCTRAGWYYLNDAEMAMANEVAAQALSTWSPVSRLQLELFA